MADVDTASLVNCSCKMLLMAFPFCHLPLPECMSLATLFVGGGGYVKAWKSLKQSYIVSLSPKNSQ